MKYRIGVFQEVGGYFTVEAKSKKQALAIADERLAYDGIDEEIVYSDMETEITHRDTSILGVETA